MVYILDRAENIVGKGDNAGYQHFLLFPQCFQKPSCPRLLKVGIVWERVNCLPSSKSFNSVYFKEFAGGQLNVAYIMFSVLVKLKTFWKKGENAGYQHFLRFPQCFQMPCSR